MLESGAIVTQPSLKKGPVLVPFYFIPPLSTTLFNRAFFKKNKTGEGGQSPLPVLLLVND